MSGTDKFITVNGLKLHYVEHGTATQPHFLYLPQAVGTGHDADILASRISDRYHVLALTQRGRGDSDRAESYEGLQFVEDTAAFLEAVGAESAVVCGVSMGGLIGLGLSALHPDKVTRLIDVDAGPAGEEITEGRQHFVDSIRNAPTSYATIDEMIEAQRLVYRGVPDAELRRCFEFNTVRGEDGGLQFKTDPALIRAIVPEAYAEMGESATNSGEMSKALWAACAAIQCPTLIVRGSRSREFTRETAERMLATIPNARLVEVDAEHDVSLENPEGFYEAVKDFI